MGLTGSVLLRRAMAGEDSTPLCRPLLSGPKNIVQHMQPRSPSRSFSSRHRGLLIRQANSGSRLARTSAEALQADWLPARQTADYRNCCDCLSRLLAARFDAVSSSSNSKRYRLRFRLANGVVCVHQNSVVCTLVLSSSSSSPPSPSPSASWVICSRTEPTLSTLIHLAGLRFTLSLEPRRPFVQRHPGRPDL